MRRAARSLMVTGVVVVAVITKSLLKLVMPYSFGIGHSP